LGIYDTYAARDRVKAGVALKERQNRKIFALGLLHGPREAPRILEIGPGDGHIAAFAAAAGLGYVAVEGSAATAEGLRARGFEVHCSYAPPLPASLAGPFTCCFLLHVIEHMPEPAKAARLIEEIRLALVPGGTLVVASPDYLRWGSDFYDADYTHCYPMTRRRVSQLLADHGFQVVHHTIYIGAIFGYAGLPVSWLGRILYSRLADGLFGRFVPRDILNRGLLAFLPNLLTIAKRAD
jgi:SAM-dependent methyltransferase